MAVFDDEMAVRRRDQDLARGEILAVGCGSTGKPAGAPQDLGESAGAGWVDVENHADRSFQIGGQVGHDSAQCLHATS